MTVEITIQGFKLSNIFLAPPHICKSHNLREGTFGIICLAEILDIHKPATIGKQLSVKVYDLLLEKGLIIG